MSEPNVAAPDTSVTDSGGEAEPSESSIPPETSTVVDVGGDVVIEPTPSGCDKVPTVPAYAGGTACTTAVANTCDCRPIGELPLGPILAIAGISPKGEALVQLRSGSSWSCPITVPGGPWVQVEWMHKRLVLRDAKGALFSSDMAWAPFALEPVRPIEGATTRIAFWASRESLVYARLSDGTVESRTWKTIGFDAPVPTAASTGLAFSFGGGLLYSNADGFVHRLGSAGDAKTSVPAGVVGAGLKVDHYGIAPFQRDTIACISADGRWYTDWPSGCPGCAGDFPTWELYVAGSFLESSILWTQGGRLFEFAPNWPDAAPHEDTRGLPPMLFDRRVRNLGVEIYARASDCGLRLLEKGVTTTLPRLVLAAPPVVATFEF